MAESEKEKGKLACCEYAKAVTGLGEFELSIRECGGQICPQSIFSNPSIYEKCPQRLKYQKGRWVWIKLNRKRFLFVFTRNRNLCLNSRVLAVTAVSTRQVLTVGVNVHSTFGKESLIGSVFDGFWKNRFPLKMNTQNKKEDYFFLHLLCLQKS